MVDILAWKMEAILQPAAVRGLRNWGCCSSPGPGKGVMNTVGNQYQGTVTASQYYLPRWAAGRGVGEGDRCQ